MTWPDVGDRRPTLVVPLGSTEQHGPHLPLDTDARIATEVARRLVAAGDVLVLGPTVAIGASGEHAGFPGTLSVGTAVFEEMIVETARSADAFAGIVWVNAHGGNSAPLRAAHARIEGEGRRSLILRCAFPNADSHAGRTETSLLLAISPDLVRLDRAEPGETRPWSEVADAILAGGVAAVAPNGVLGDPSGASAEEGSRLLDELVAALTAAVARWTP